MAMIMGNVEDERCLSNLGFMKNKLKNRLTTPLGLVVKMLVQKFITLKIFPFVATINSWIIAKFYHGVEG
jgi:hypothetical protein